MNRNKLIRMGTFMGLSYDESSMFEQDIKKGTVVFDGCNGQRFLIESKWEDDKIHHELGQALIYLGKRIKCLELHNALSILSDND